SSLRTVRTAASSSITKTVESLRGCSFMARCDPGWYLMHLSVIVPALRPALAQSRPTDGGAAELAFDHSRNTREASKWTHPWFSLPNTAGTLDVGVPLLDPKPVTLSLPTWSGCISYAHTRPPDDPRGVPRKRQSFQHEPRPDGWK